MLLQASPLRVFQGQQCAAEAIERLLDGRSRQEEGAIPAGALVWPARCSAALLLAGVGVELARGCTHCRRVRRDGASHLLLKLPGMGAVHSAQGLVDAYGSRPRCTAADSLCVACGAQGTLYERSVIRRVGTVLFLHLPLFDDAGNKRFGVRITASDLLQVPVEGRGRVPFRLLGGVEHRGASRAAGHYVATVRAPDGLVWTVNDARTSRSSMQHLLGTQHYVLAYAQVDLPPLAPPAQPKLGGGAPHAPGVPGGAASSNASRINRQKKEEQLKGQLLLPFGPAKVVDTSVGRGSAFTLTVAQIAQSAELHFILRAPWHAAFADEIVVTTASGLGSVHKKRRTNGVLIEGTVTHFSNEAVHNYRQFPKRTKHTLCLTPPTHFPECT